VSYTFGEDAIVDKCAELDLDMIVRAHQVVHDGFEIFAKGKCITLFSAPDYADQYDNHGAILFVDANLKCKIRKMPSRKRVEPPSKDQEKI